MLLYNYCPLIQFTISKLELLSRYSITLIISYTGQSYNYIIYCLAYLVPRWAWFLPPKLLVIWDFLFIIIAISHGWRIDYGNTLFFYITKACLCIFLFRSLWKYLKHNCNIVNIFILWREKKTAFEIVYKNHESIKDIIICYYSNIIKNVWGFPVRKKKLQVNITHLLWIQHTLMAIALIVISRRKKVIITCFIKINK